MRYKFIALTGNSFLTAWYKRFKEAGIECSKAYHNYGAPVAIDTRFIIPVTNTNLLSNLQHMQNLLKSIIGSQHIFNAIPDSMHITLYNHAFDDDTSNYYDIELETQNAAKILNSANIGKWDIMFKGLLVTHNSIIIKGFDNGIADQYRLLMVLSGIRHDFYDIDRIDPIYPKIVNITLAILNNPLDPSIIREINNKYGDTVFGTENVENIYIRNFDRNAMYSPGKTYYSHNV
jgi:hypothetical protein